ncbi:MAG: DUF485 domain-containing protein [Gammaproteobacteria bacterium]|nr:DUF485 domain-containing protein [Gammaproteobacteria bacterium]
MDDSTLEVLERLRGDPDYHRHARRRALFSWLLTGVMALAALAFLAGLVYGAGWYARPVRAGGVVTVGMLAALALVFGCLAMTVIYVQVCGRVIDPAGRALRERARTASGQAR